MFRLSFAEGETIESAVVVHGVDAILPENFETLSMDALIEQFAYPAFRQLQAETELRSLSKVGQ
jgi:hypothetical protein